MLPDMQQKLPLMSNISTELEEKIFRALLSWRWAVALSAVKDDNKDTYSTRVFDARRTSLLLLPVRERR